MGPGSLAEVRSLGRGQEPWAGLSGQGAVRVDGWPAYHGGQGAFVVRGPSIVAGVPSWWLGAPTVARGLSWSVVGFEVFRGGMGAPRQFSDWQL